MRIESLLISLPLGSSLSTTTIMAEAETPVKREDSPAVDHAVKKEPLKAETETQQKTEISELKTTVASQMSLIQPLAVQVKDRAPSSEPSLSTSKLVIVTKPRDIPDINLHHLEGPDAAGKLNIFELAEQCAAIDDGRVLVAKSRVCSDIATLLFNNQEKGKCKTWEESFLED